MSSTCSAQACTWHLRVPSHPLTPGREAAIALTPEAGGKAEGARRRAQLHGSRGPDSSRLVTPGLMGSAHPRGPPSPWSSPGPTAWPSPAEVSGVSSPPTASRCCAPATPCGSPGDCTNDRGRPQAAVRVTGRSQGTSEAKNCQNSKIKGIKFTFHS